MKLHRALFLLLALSVAALAAAQTTALSTTLSGAQEVPGPADPDGSGVAVVTINGTTLTFTVLVTNIAAPTNAHIHRGNTGVAGDVVVDFTPTFTSGTATGTKTITQALANEIAGNPSGFYVNVHTADFPSGAIRGQLGTVGSSGARVTYVPVVGKVTGAAGTNFVTDVRIVNGSNATANVTLDYFQSGSASSTPTASKAYTVAPGEQKVIDDVIGALAASGLGGFRITSDQNVTVTARVINDLRASNLGTTGFAFSAREASSLSTTGTLSFLSQSALADISAGVGFRTNIGYFNNTASPVTLTLTARRTSDGAVLGTNVITVPAFGQAQSGVFQLISNVPSTDQVQANFYVTWTASAPIFVYASAVDNKTGDSVLVQ
jgi:hypothetical protein